jgi:lipopolysaccharide export system permease protein
MRLLDLYILQRTFKPLSASLIVVLAALLLERSLRLFSLLVERGSPMTLIVEMASNLALHYLGLALPAAFFISILLVIGRLDEDNELDAMRNTGLSLRRVCLPFFVTAAALAGFGLLLYGYLQPYSRYDYRALFHLASSGQWDATLQQGVFLTRGSDFTISADAVDPSGRRLAGVIVHEIRDHETVITTASTGRLDISPDGRRAILTLYDGKQLRNADGGDRATLLTFSALRVDRVLNPDVLPFRPRGGDERELTLDELRQELRTPAGDISWTRIDAELHARLARSASMLVLPLVAVPLGLASKRSRRGHGVVIASIILLAYHHLLLLGESLADTGRISAPLALWVPVAALALFGAWTFRRVDAIPDRNPLEYAIEAAEAAVRTLGHLRPRRAGVER